LATKAEDTEKIVIKSAVDPLVRSLALGRFADRRSAKVLTEREFGGRGSRSAEAVALRQAQ